MNVAELTASLSLVPDPAGFLQGNKLIAGVIGALSTLAGFVGLTSMIDTTTDLANSVSNLAARTGLANEEFQVLNASTVRAGSTADDLAGALAGLTTNMEAAVAGGEDQQKSFRKLGAALKDETGKMRPIRDVFIDIAKNQAGMADETYRNALLLKLMGDSGTKLLPVMDEIATKGFGKMTEEAKAMGAVLADDSIAKLKEFKRTQEQVTQTLGGIRNEVVVAVLPAFKRLADSTLKWIQANRELLRQGLEKAMRGLAITFEWVGRGIALVGRGVRWLTEHTGVLYTAIVALTSVMTVMATTAMWAGVKMAAAWVVAQWPLLLIIAIISAVILIVEDLITAFQGGNSVLQEIVKERLGGDLVKSLTTLGEKTAEIFRKVTNFVTGMIDAMFDRFQVVYGFIDEVLNGDEQFKFDEAAVGRRGAIGVDSLRKQFPDASKVKREDLAKALVADPENLGFRRPTDAEISQYYDTVSTRAQAASNSINAPVTIKIDGSKDVETTKAAVRDEMSNFFGDLLVATTSGVGGGQRSESSPLPRSSGVTRL